jgi:hypothetical protein
MALVFLLLLTLLVNERVYSCTPLHYVAVGL